MKIIIIQISTGLTRLQTEDKNNQSKVTVGKRVLHIFHWLRGSYTHKMVSCADCEGSLFNASFFRVSRVDLFYCMNYILMKLTMRHSSRVC